MGLTAAAALALMSGRADAAPGASAAVTAPPVNARGHVGGVRSVLMLPDKQTVATMGKDRMIKLWSRHAT